LSTIVTPSSFLFSLPRPVTRATTLSPSAIKSWTVGRPQFLERKRRIV
jgi:hypothetical protein